MTMAPSSGLFGNDTLCRSLIIAASAVNSSTDVQCNTCLTYGCTWCKRAKFPFCWSGSSNDLPKSQNLQYTTCPASSAVYSTNREQSAITSTCQNDNQISAGAVAALIIWALILICCIGACCCTVVYFAYNRGKRQMGMVHADDFSSYSQSRGGHYVAHAGEPWPHEHNHEGPLQVGIIAPPGDPFTNGVQLSEFGDGHFCSQEQVPVAIAHPIR